MNVKLLIILDKCFAPLLLTLTMLLFARKYFFSLFRLKGDGVLIIKFLGAGNFMSLPKKCNSPGYTFLTLSTNANAVRLFFPEAKVLCVSSENFLKMGISFIRIFMLLLPKVYFRVVNLESDSFLSKLFALVPYCQDTRGLSTDRKSLIDHIIYDKHVVVSSDQERGQMSGFLIDNFEEIMRPNLRRQSQIKKISSEVVGKKKIDLPNERNYLVIAPTCSRTDKNRRLDAQTWSVVVSELWQRGYPLLIVFDTKHDPQFDFFKEIESKFEYVSVRETKYHEFVKIIRECRGLITIDSQALHIAQHYDREVLCFYGPTSPNGIYFGRKTTPVSNHFYCSPCTHSYFTEPCAGKAPCQIYHKKRLAHEISAFLSRVSS